MCAISAGSIRDSWGGIKRPSTLSRLVQCETGRKSAERQSSRVSPMRIALIIAASLLALIRFTGLKVALIGRAHAASGCVALRATPEDVRTVVTDADPLATSQPTVIVV